MSLSLICTAEIHQNPPPRICMPQHATVVQPRCKTLRCSDAKALHITCICHRPQVHTHCCMVHSSPTHSFTSPQSLTHPAHNLNSTIYTSRSFMGTYTWAHNCALTKFLFQFSSSLSHHLYPHFPYRSVMHSDTHTHMHTFMQNDARTRGHKGTHTHKRTAQLSLLLLIQCLQNHLGFQRRRGPERELLEVQEYFQDPLAILPGIHMQINSGKTTYTHSFAHFGKHTHTQRHRHRHTHTHLYNNLHSCSCLRCNNKLSCGSHLAPASCSRA